MNLREQLRLTWWVTLRELVDQLRDWRILLPMGTLILFFPYLMNYAALRSIDFVNQYGGNLIAERIVPFLLMVVGFFPVTVSLVVALEAFVGEKERGTLEPLLSSPLADWQMYVGKLLAGSLVPLAASYISMGLYLVGLLIQKIPFPPLDLLIQMLLLTAAQTVLMVSAAIIISTQSTSVRAANLLASFIVIPAALLIQGESALIFWGTNQVLWLAIVAVLIVTALVVRLGLAHFQREALIGREIDVLNLRWTLQLFWRRFTGGAHSLGEWYGKTLRATLFSMRFSVLITLLVGVFAIFATQLYANSWLGGFKLPEDKLSEALTQVQSSLLDGLPGSLSFGYIFGNNLRAEVLVLFFGVFSFGVGGLVIYLLNFALIGGVLSVVSWLGLSPWGIFLYGILPHGILELPSVILSTAAVLFIGLRLITPQKQSGLGETLVESLADWAQVSLGIAFPLLVLAALIETYLTPLLLIRFLTLP
ncbi:MAG: hypothetical protein CO094_00545 [Anaerolineae bacterium CG_4_9_14_3_um_filter_57_17]|nr:ABC transporter permease subunit [bacterium]NCT20816.1 ABC transporter permease subunit [bacterium]OIO84164.1 MAG: hypothetical protein AUK01_10390 [Anaerolineae bacterium CG2_30_57_67]PJB68673.1 MAG: hypothetical protein CO094_00545 [Anaerolineae bacterium CG_4_9_14_3_um_filter_57_17]